MNKTLIAITALALGLTLAGCGNNDQASQTTPASHSASESKKITVDDAWVKATDSDMTAMFGTVKNPTGHDRTIVKAESDVAGMVQLHETVPTDGGSTEMREKKGGFPLPANGSKKLEPGADHVMLMGLNTKLVAGDMVKVTLTLDDDSTVRVDAPVKPFSGAKETYAPTEEASNGEHSGHGAHAGHGDHDQGHGK